MLCGRGRGGGGPRPQLFSAHAARQCSRTRTNLQCTLGRVPPRAALGGRRVGGGWPNGSCGGCTHQRDQAFEREAVQHCVRGAGSRDGVRGEELCELFEQVDGCEVDVVVAVEVSLQP